MIRQTILASLKKATGMDDIHLESPDRSENGDYSTNVALQLKGKKSKVIAQEIIEKLNGDEELKKIIEKIEVAGPGFINFYLKNDVLLNNLKQIEIDMENYGRSNDGKGKKWLIEHTSPNPNKAMHLGHLRNNVTGMAISNLWEFTGVKVIRDDVDNNRGIAIAKLMWGYLKFAHKSENDADINYWYDHQDEWQTPEDQKIEPDKFIDQLYVKASEKFENDEKVEAEVRQLVVDWEAGDIKNRALWKKVLDYSYEGQEKTLQRLGNKWDKIWREHEHYNEGKELVEVGLKKRDF